MPLSFKSLTSKIRDAKKEKTVIFRYYKRGKREPFKNKGAPILGHLFPISLFMQIRNNLIVREFPARKFLDSELILRGSPAATHNRRALPGIWPQQDPC